MAENLELRAILKMNAQEFLNGANQAQKKLGELGASAEKSNAQLKNAVPKVDMSAAFGTLGVRSSQEIQSEITKVQGAYNALKGSGQASAADLDRAHQAMTSKVATLNAEMGKLPPTANAAASGFGGFGGALGGLIAPMVSAGAAMGALQFGMASLQKAGNDQRWEMGLREQVAFTGKAAKLSVEQMKALTQEVTKTTFASEGDARKSVSIMTSFMSVQDENFKRAIFMAQDLAEVLGSNMSGAAMQLGKALENPANGISAMADSGVTFTAQQKEVIMALVETGKKAEAQKLILDAVGSQLGNTGAAAAKGYAGAVDQMGKAWENFKGTIGGTLLEGAADSVRSLTSTIKELSEAYQLTFGSDKKAGDVMSQTLGKSKELSNKGLKADNASNLNATQQNQLRDGLIQQISALEAVKTELDIRIDSGRSVDMEKYTQLTAQLRQYKQELATVNQVMNTNGVQKYGSDTAQVLSQIKDKSANLAEMRQKYDLRMNESKKNELGLMLGEEVKFNFNSIKNTKFKVDEIFKLEQDLANKQRQIAKQKADYNESIDDRIRNKKRSGMTEAGQQDDIEKQAKEKLQKAEAARARGDTAMAKKFADEAVNLADSLEDVDLSIELMEKARGSFNATLDQNAGDIKKVQDELAAREGSTAKMEVDISSAEQTIGNLIAQFDQIREQTITLDVDASKLYATLNELKAAGVVNKEAFPTAQKFATGGQLSGFGGGDRIPALLEAGEFVINKDSTRQHNNLLHLINYFPEKVPRFATGGGIGLPDISLPNIEIPKALQESGSSKPPEIMVLKWENNAGQTGQIKTFMDQREEIVRFTSAFKQAGRGT